MSSSAHLGWPWDRDGSSHPTKILSHPGPGIEPGRDRELPSHRDLVSSHPMKKNLVPSRSCEMPGWDRDGTGHPVSCQEMLLFYNIHIGLLLLLLLAFFFYCCSSPSFTIACLLLLLLLASFFYFFSPSSFTFFRLLLFLF